MYVWWVTAPGTGKHLSMLCSSDLLFYSNERQEPGTRHVRISVTYIIVTDDTEMCASVPLFFSETDVHQRDNEMQTNSIWSLSSSRWRRILGWVA